LPFHPLGLQLQPTFSPLLHDSVRTLNTPTSKKQPDEALAKVLKTVLLSF